MALEAAAKNCCKKLSKHETFDVHYTMVKASLPLEQLNSYFRIEKSLHYSFSVNDLLEMKINEH